MLKGLFVSLVSYGTRFYSGCVGCSASTTCLTFILHMCDFSLIL